MQTWNQFKGYDSLSPRHVKQVSGKRKDHRLEKYKSKILISEVSTPRNLRTGPMKRLKDNSDASEARDETLPKTRTRTRQNTNAASYSPAEECVLWAASMKKPEERKREFVVDSGAGVHMVSKKDHNSAELETMRTSKNPTTVMTANGEVLTREEAAVCVKELDFFVTVMLLEQTPAVFSLGKL